MNRDRHPGASRGIVGRRARKILDTIAPLVDVVVDESEIATTHGRTTRRDNAYNRENAMKDRTLIAIAPDGTRIERRTHRTYTHVVVGCKAGEWAAVGWCGSQELADKRLRQAEKDEVGYREWRARTGVYGEKYDPIKHDSTDFQILLVEGA